MKLITNVAADCSQLRSLAGVVSLPQLTTTRPATRYHILFAERSAPSMATSRRASTTAASATSPSQGANENSTTRSSQQNPAYELLRITGDGRCMFRSLAQGAHLASSAEAGLPIALLPPSEEIAEADSLRQVVCDELLRRKDDIAPFIDIDYGSSFETYVQRMRQPGCWGGEPELAVAYHVLKRPIAVYMAQQRQLGKISEYGVEEYSKQAVPLFFHGVGHYDLLVASGSLNKQPRAKL